MDLEERTFQPNPSEELIEHNLSRAHEAWRSDGGIGSAGFDPQILSRLSRIGARPVKRLIQKELLNEMSRAPSPKRSGGVRPDHRRHLGARR